MPGVVCSAIAVQTVSAAAAGLALDNQSVDENEPAGTPVGELSATDPDGDPLTYALVSGTGGDDNADFAIDGTTLETGASFDAEAKSSDPQLWASHHHGVLAAAAAGMAVLGSSLWRRS